MRLHASAVGLVALLALAGCKGPAPSSTGQAGADAATTGADASARGAAHDGGADAASPPATAAPSDRTLRVVAEADSATPPSFVLTADARLFVVSGPFLYEPRPDGALEVLGGAAAYAPLYAGSEDALVGYLSHPRIERVVDSAAGAGALDVKLVGESAGGYRIDKGALSLLDAAAFKGDAGARAPEEPDAATVIGSVAAAKGAATKCRRLPSFDGRAYAACRARGAGAAGDKVTFHVKEGDAYKPAFVAAAGVDDKGSIGADGALYVAGTSAASFAVFRCAPDAACDKLPVELDPEPKDPKAAAPAPPSYVTSFTDAMDSAESKYWQSFSIGGVRAGQSGLQAEQVLARGPGDVWVLARTSPSSARVYFHSGAARPRARLASDLDARVLVRNEKAPAVWVGHCDQVFVRLAGTRGDAPLAIEAVKAKVPEIKATLAVRTDDDFYTPFEWTLVEGRLHDERVAGVVVRRSDVEAKVERMERAVDKLVDKLATNPMSRPKVTCTLPVLAAVHASGS